MLSEQFQKVLSGYLEAKNTPFAKSDFAKILTRNIPEEIASHLSNKEAYKVEGSAGKGVWVNCPWVAVFDINITDSAQRGFYPVYLFNSRMEGVYLTLNFGITDIRNRYPDPKKMLETAAKEKRGQLLSVPNGFSADKIDLGYEGKNELAYWYELGNVYSKYYPKDNIPNDKQLYEDLDRILLDYQTLKIKELRPSNESELEEDEVEPGEEKEPLSEDPSLLRLHKRYDRNPKLAKEAKKIHGYSCQACGFNYADKYGDIGKDYIEAHHLELFSKIKTKVFLDPKKDFAVVCANCHRMLHRLKDKMSVDELKKIIRLTDI